MDVADVDRSGATWCRTSSGTRQNEEEAWFIGDQRLGAGRRRRRWPAGTSTRRSTPSLGRHRPGDVGRRRARLALMDEYGIQAQVLYPNVAVFDAKTHPGAWTTPSCSSRASGPTTTSSSTWRSAAPGRLHPGDVAAVLGPRRDAGRDRALRRARAQGHRVHPGPVVLRAARAHRPALGPDVGVGAGEGAAGQLPHRVRRHRSLFTRRPSRQRRPRQLRGDGRVVLHGQRPHDRPADHRRHLPPLPGAQLRVGRERRRLDPVRPRGARLAVEELRRRTSSTPSTTCCRASTSAARSTAASGSSATRPCRRIEQLGADNILYETDFPHPTSMSPGPASSGSAPDDYLDERASAASTSRRCARSSTTTPPASTTSTDAHGATSTSSLPGGMSSWPMSRGSRRCGSRSARSSAPAGALLHTEPRRLPLRRRGLLRRAWVGVRGSDRAEGASAGRSRRLP